MSRYEISHVSRYYYSKPVQGCVMSLCLKPRDDAAQRLLSFELTTVPPSSMNSEADSFGNTKHVLNINQEHEALEIAALSTVETMAPAPVAGRLGAGAWAEMHSLRDSFAHWDFTHPSTLTGPTAALGDFVDRLDVKAEGDPLEALTRLSDALHHGLKYVPGSTTVASPIDDILESGRGVCQDYAHVMIAIARSWGAPSRYVSGYVPLESRGMAPASASHAWVECLLPGLGWAGFDPTNGCLAGEGHVRIAVGRDYRDVAPTRGVMHGGGETRLEVDVRVHHEGSASGEDRYSRPPA